MPLPIPNQWYTSPLMRPHTNDIANAFGRVQLPREASGSSPLVPIFSRHLPPTTRQPSILEDPSNHSAVGMFLRINHPAIHLSDVLHLQRRVRQLRKNEEEAEEEKAPVTPPQVTVQMDGPVKMVLQSQSSNITLDESLQSETQGSMATSNSTTKKNENVPLKDDPCFAKYYNMLKMELPRGAVENAMLRDKADVSLLDLDPEKSLQSQRSTVQDDQTTEYATGTVAKTTENHSSDVPLKDDPCFAKYYKMLKMRLPRGAVENAMTRDNADLTLLDLDPEKSLQSQLPNAAAVTQKSDVGMIGMGNEGDNVAEQTSDSAQETNKEESSNEDVPLKDDPCFAKYYKMLKMQLPRGAVENAMIRDNADLTLLDLDPEKSLKSQQGNAISDRDPPLKDDPCFAKYYKMLKMMLPRGAVENAMVRDGADVTLLDLDPEKSLKSQRGASLVEDEGPPLKDDPCFAKYYKMLKMQLPRGAVENAMARDGVDVTLLDLDPEKSLKSQRGCPSTTADTDPPLKDDPAFSKYYKMLKMGLPRGAVENAMNRDGADTTLLDLDPEKSVASQRGGGVVDDGPPLKDDPSFSKYYKMLKMGLPRGAVENAMNRDGADASMLDLDPDKSLVSQRGGGVVDEGPPLKDDPVFSKYYKMLKMGLPRGAVENAMSRDGADISILDLDPEKSLSSQRKGDAASKGPARGAALKKKKRVKRRKIFWSPIDPGQIKEDSIWSMVKGKFHMDKLNYDIKEFEDLFTESPDINAKQKSQQQKTAKPEKKSVQVIDGKRSMNGGIVLKRLKMDYKIIAEVVNAM